VRERVFRLLLRLYPTSFRLEFEEQLVEVFAYRAQKADRAAIQLAQIRFWLFIVADTVRTAFAEHRRTTRSDGARNTDGGGGMEGLLQDIRYSMRRLVRSPGFTLSVLTILGFGIGLNTAAFSLVNSLLLQEPPFFEPSRLVEVLQDSDGGGPTSTSYPAFQDIAQHTEVFSSVAARASGDATLELDGQLSPVRTEYATANFFTTLGISTSRGRWFEPQEDHAGAGPVAVMSHQMWTTRFASNAGVVGTSLRLNGASVTVVGIGPESYNGGIGPAVGDLWLSFSAMAQLGGPAGSLTRRGDHPFRVTARLNSGVTRDDATTAMTRLASRLSEEFPNANRDRGIHVLPMATIGAERREAVLPVAGMVLFVVALVLLVASINLANILLVRGIARSKEIGVRMALGGSRHRLIRVLFGEVVLLALAGGGVGLGLAWLLLDQMRLSEINATAPFSLDVRMDLSVVAFTLLASLFASVVAGLLPALRATRTGATDLITNRNVRRDSKRFGLIGMLVSAQVAVSLVLLVTAGLFIESVISAISSDPGFDTEGLAILQVALEPLDLGREEMLPTVERLFEDVDNLPGVQNAALAFAIPVGYRGTTTLLVGDMVDGRRRPVEVPWNLVHQNYFETVGIPLLHGRLFDQRDGPDGPNRAVVSSAMAQAFWGRTDVVGESYYSENDPDRGVEIIGVVGDISLHAVGEPPRPAVYWSTALGIPGTFHILARTDGTASTLLRTMRRAVKEVDPRIAVLKATTMDAFLSASQSRQKMTSGLLALVGAFALGLATIGIYSVVSFGVSRRRKEVGIRIALGAAKTSVLGLFLRDAGWVIGLGILAGMVVSVPVSQFVGTVFTGTQEFPTGVLATCLVTLSVAAFIATVVPARRASQEDPTSSLRQE